MFCPGTTCKTVCFLPVEQVWKQWGGDKGGAKKSKDMENYVFCYIFICFSLVFLVFLWFSCRFFPWIFPPCLPRPFFRTSSAKNALMPPRRTCSTVFWGGKTPGQCLAKNQALKSGISNRQLKHISWSFASIFCWSAYRPIAIYGQIPKPFNGPMTVIQKLMRNVKMLLYIRIWDPWIAETLRTQAFLNKILPKPYVHKHFGP